MFCSFISFFSVFNYYMLLINNNTPFNFDPLGPCPGASVYRSMVGMSTHCECVFTSRHTVFTITFIIYYMKLYTQLSWLQCMETLWLLRLWIEPLSVLRLANVVVRDRRYIKLSGVPKGSLARQHDVLRHGHCRIVFTLNFGGLNYD